MEQNPINPLNQKTSQQIHPTKVDINRIINVLVKEVEKLKKEISEIKDGRIIDILKLPEKNNVLSTTHRLKNKKNWRPLSESEIDEAQLHSENATEAAKYLGINYQTYRKWCVFHNKWKINPWGKGSKKKYWNPNRGKYPLNQILEGKFPNYPVYRLKDLLIRSEIKKAECEVCGRNDRRVTDGKMPILLNFKDGDEHNHKLDNLQLLCYYCYFLQGRGYIRRGKIEFNFLDLD